MPFTATRITGRMHSHCHAECLTEDFSTHLLLGLSRALDLRLSSAVCRGSSMEQLREPPSGRDANVCRLRELLGESVICTGTHPQ